MQVDQDITATLGIMQFKIIYSFAGNNIIMFESTDHKEK